MDANQLSKYTQSISSSDPSVRFAGMHEIADLLERSPDKAGNEVLPLLDKGLNDTDVKVRALAAGSVAMIAAETTPKLGSSKMGLPDLLSFAPLKGDLEKDMFDSDAQVRRAALGAYFFTFDVSPDLQSKLIGQFAGGEKTGLQPAIIDALLTCESPTPDTQAFLTNLIRRPQACSFCSSEYSDGAGLVKNRASARRSVVEVGQYVNDRNRWLQAPAFSPRLGQIRGASASLSRADRAVTAEGIRCRYASKLKGGIGRHPLRETAWRKLNLIHLAEPLSSK